MDGKANSNSVSSPGFSLVLVIGGLTVVYALTVFTVSRMHLNHFVGDAFQRLIIYPWIPAAIALYVIGFWLRGLRLKFLASEEAQLSTLTATNIIAIGHFANNILPFRLGELVRAAMLTERTGLPIVQTLTIAACERVFDGLSIVGLLLISAMFLPLDGWMEHSFQIYSWFFVVSVLALFALSVVPQLLINVTTTLTSSTLPGWQNRALSVVSQVVRGLSFFSSVRRLVFILILSLLIWLVEACFFGLIMPSFSLPFDLPISTATMGFTNLRILTPSSPASLGRYQYYCAAAMQALSAIKLHVIPAPSLTEFYALTVHTIYFTVTSSWGIIALTVYARRLAEKTWMRASAKPVASLADLIAESQAPRQVVLSSQPRKQDLIEADQFWKLLCESLIGVESLAVAGERKGEALKGASGFVVRQVAQLPRTLQIQLEIGLRVFRAYAFCVTLQPFCMLPLERRIKVVDHWATGPVSLARKMFRPLRSLTLLGYFEEESVRIGLAAAADSSQVSESAAQGAI